MEEEKHIKSWFNNTVLFLVISIIFIFLLSVIGSALNWEGTYYELNTITNKLDSHLIAVESLFSREGIRYIIGNVVSNFINFTPLVMFIFTMIGIGFAEKTGLFSSLFGLFGKKLKKFWLTFIVVLISIISTIIGDIGFVFVIPLAAIIFLVSNRNPIIGIISSFVGMAAGHGVNLFITQMDYNLLGYTKVGANLIDKAYTVSIYGNIYFGIVATILLTFLITYITEKFVVKKVGKYKKEEVLEDNILDKKKKKGLFLAAMAALIYLLFFVYMLIPFGSPLSGLLLDYAEKDAYARIFSGNSYVIQGLSFTLLAMLLTCGWVYGITTKTIKNRNDLSTYLFDSLNNMGGALVLFFFASQLVALFKKTNLGPVFTIWVGKAIEDLGFTSIPLVLIFFILVSVVNIFSTSTTTKWTILAPIVIPTFMKTNITPEFTQAIFKAGDSITNMISPLFPYFAVFIGMLLLYNKNEDTIKIKDVYKLLMPYLIGIFIFWLLLLTCWYIINLPIGTNVYPIL